MVLLASNWCYCCLAAALLSANGVQSALTVASTMASCLVVVNAGAAVAIVLSLFRSAREWTRRDNGVGADAFADVETCCWWWSALDEKTEATRTTTTGNSRKQPIELPSTLSSMSTPLLLRQWVYAIMDAKVLCLNALLATPSMRSSEELDASLERLTVSHAEALHAKHLLAVRARSQHLLKALGRYKTRVLTSGGLSWLLMNSCRVFLAVCFYTNI